MRPVPEQINAFLGEHHVLTLATVSGTVPQCCSLFYAYLPDGAAFVVASGSETEHMTNALRNPKVAGAVVLETKKVGQIRGVQFKGSIAEADDAARKAYFRAFPYALAMNPELWTVTLVQMKLTDNRLGFGKKLLWER